MVEAVPKRRVEEARERRGWRERVFLRGEEDLRDPGGPSEGTFAMVEAEPKRRVEEARERDRWRVNRRDIVVLGSFGTSGRGRLESRRCERINRKCSH
jgi:hypothetical protein